MMLNKMAYSKEYLVRPQIAEHHKANNSVIEEALQLFMETNNLSSTDFIVVGSSGASYMDYLVLREVKDVDIVMLTDREVQKTDMIDILYKIIRPTVFDIKIKNGYQFISKEDFLITSTISAILKFKSSNIYYTKLMCVDLGLSTGDLKRLMFERIPRLQSDIPVQFVDKVFIERMLAYDMLFSDESIIEMRRYLSTMSTENNE